MSYNNYAPFANKLLQPNGSITTFDGTVIEPSSTSRAADYESRMPIAAKFLMPGDEITDILPVSISGTDEDGGYNGYSPVLALQADGDRVVMQVINWTGGTGVKPAIGEYVGASGLVTDIALAVDIRGARGLDGYTPVKGVDYNDGNNGKDATINGFSNIEIVGGQNTTVEMEGNKLWIDSTDTGGDGVQPEWGNITGDITDQADLINYVDDIVGDIGAVLDSINRAVI